MKIDKQLPVTTVLDSRARSQTQLPDSPIVPRRASEARTGESSGIEKPLSKGAGFSLQLNQQLTSMQSAERYLSELSDQLSALKLNLSRQISSPQSAGERENIASTLQQLNSLLEQRAKRSGESLDATFKLRLNEPLRSRFSLQGLESIEAVQRSGKETLLFSAGRYMSEPLAVVLDDGMGDEQVLRRFNNSLGQAGIRAELDQDGALKFSAPEADWQSIKQQLRIQGEDKLFSKASTAPVASYEDGLLAFPIELSQDTFRELRQLLDSVVSALERVGALREQLSQRQADVRDFLARQESQDEKRWALGFASSVFDHRGPKSPGYSLVSQTVLAQANLTRFAVVSLLS